MPFLCVIIMIFIKIFNKTVRNILIHCNDYIYTTASKHLALSLNITSTYTVYQVRCLIWWSVKAPCRGIPSLSFLQLAQPTSELGDPEMFVV